VSDISEGEGLSKIGLLNDFLKFRPYFFGQIHRMISDHGTAEDIFQEACLRFLSSVAVFKYPQAGTKYFCLIIRSLALQHLHSGRWIEYRSQLPDAICEPQDAWERNMLLDSVSQAVSSLPDKDQDLLDIFFRPGLTLEDKCKALHLPNSTMRHRAGKTIAKIRKMVAKGSKNSLCQSSFRT
jgi:RNA polymerase sigma factor (sigma-70 family)